MKNRLSLLSKTATIVAISCASISINANENGQILCHIKNSWQEMEEGLQEIFINARPKGFDKINKLNIEAFAPTKLSSKDELSRLIHSFQSKIYHLMDTIKALFKRYRSAPLDLIKEVQNNYVPQDMIVKLEEELNIILQKARAQHDKELVEVIQHFMKYLNEIKQKWSVQNKFTLLGNLQKASK